MTTNLFIGKVSFDATQSQLHDLFAQAGQVTNIVLVTDRWTAMPKGFAFIEMETQRGARAAIKRFNGTSFLNSTLVVREATPADERMGNSMSGNLVTSDSTE